MSSQIGHDPQLLKGLVSLLILAVVKKGESYGYEIASRLRDFGLEDFKEGTVYPALARLERDGLLSTRLVESSSGPARKYYAITPRGRKRFSKMHEMWQTLSKTVDQACKG